MIKKGLKTFKIFSLDLISNSREDLLAFLGKAVDRGERLFLVTPNVEYVIASKNDSGFLKTLQGADLIIPDGIGLVWARKLVKKRSFGSRIWSGFLVGLKVLKGDLADELITGVGLMVEICRLAAQKNWSVYLFGGQPGVSREALVVLKKRFPGLIGWAESGPEVKGQSTVDFRPWIKKINQKKPTFLFTAFGMKKQEEFIWKNWPELRVKAAIGVGGAFDFLSGRVKRAPVWWRRSGLEWLFRLFRQPWRWRRQLALLKFIWLVLATNP
jgi:N-acetylglucosaminyldiphosphoundecaprenol N-acetyl-beta-D-mannosaminyltransferase